MGVEFRAGTASFLTLSYLLLVNPSIMDSAGVSQDDALLATALSAAIACFIVGFLGNLPFGCAPGIGLSAYLAYGLVQAELCTLQEALTVCWWSGIVVILITLSGLVGLLMKIVPQAIKYGIVVGKCCTSNEHSMLPPLFLLVCYGLSFTQLLIYSSHCKLFIRKRHGPLDCHDWNGGRWINRRKRQNSGSARGRHGRQYAHDVPLWSFARLFLGILGCQRSDIDWDCRFDVDIVDH